MYFTEIVLVTRNMMRPGCQLFGRNRFCVSILDFRFEDWTQIKGGIKSAYSLALLHVIHVW